MRVIPPLQFSFNDNIKSRNLILGNPGVTHSFRNHCMNAVGTFPNHCMNAVGTELVMHECSGYWIGHIWVTEDEKRGCDLIFC